MLVPGRVDSIPYNPRLGLSSNASPSIPRPPWRLTKADAVATGLSVNDLSVGDGVEGPIVVNAWRRRGDGKPYSYDLAVTRAFYRKII
jgi:hypothetical protein